MKFNNDAANSAANFIALTLLGLALVTALGYALWCIPWPLRAFLLTVIAVPVLAGLFVKERKT